MSDRSIPFTKMSGSGNDFVVIDNRAGLLRDIDVSSLTKSISRQRLSVGADGVVLISEPPPDSPSLSYTWRYVNADGTDGEMCGNGAMCAARFAVRAGIADPHHSFLTESGSVEAWANADSAAATIAIPDPGPVESPLTVSVLDLDLECTRIMVGVPHIVIITSDADDFADAEAFHAIGRSLRLHPAFAPAGTNVNVVSRIDERTWRMRTYERGVEAETLACGTGAVASAVVLGKLGMAPNPIQIRASGGRDLTVAYEWRDGLATRVRLSGHAAVIYEGVLGPDATVS